MIGVDSVCWSGEEQRVLVGMKVVGVCWCMYLDVLSVKVDDSFLMIYLGISSESMVW